MQHNPDQERIEKQKKIERILLSFKDVKGSNYRLERLIYANQLVDFRKSHLEIAKSNLEYEIDNLRNYNAISALCITFSIIWIPLLFSNLIWRTFTIFIFIFFIICILIQIYI